MELLDPHTRVCQSHNRATEESVSEAQAPALHLFPPQLQALAHQRRFLRAPPLAHLCLMSTWLPLRWVALPLSQLQFPLVRAKNRSHPYRQLQSVHWQSPLQYLCQPVLISLWLAFGCNCLWSKSTPPRLKSTKPVSRFQTISVLSCLSSFCMVSLQLSLSLLFQFIYLVL